MLITGYQHGEPPSFAARRKRGDRIRRRAGRPAKQEKELIVCSKLF